MNTSDTRICTPQQRTRMGEILVKSRLIDDETLASALEIQKSQKRRLGQVLVDMGVADQVVCRNECQPQAYPRY